MTASMLGGILVVVIVETRPPRAGASIRRLPCVTNDDITTSISAEDPTTFFWTTALQRQLLRWLVWPVRGMSFAVPLFPPDWPCYDDQPVTFSTGSHI